MSSKAWRRSIRVRILKLLRQKGLLNVNEISRELGLPQSTVAINIQVLESAGLIDTHTIKAKKGHQKLCSARYDEIIVRFEAEEPIRDKNLVEVQMPLGLMTSCEVSAPCGLCSTEGVIGLLDVPDLFLDPDRVRAALIWFGRGYVEYKFPNNAKLLNSDVESVEFSMELSSEVPGTNLNWPSDITLWVNGVAVGTWTSPGDYRRQARRLYAELVEARGLAIRQAEDLAGEQGRLLRRWRAHLRRHHRRPRTAAPPFHPHAHRHRRQGEPSRRRQHLRQGLRQLRPGHRHAAAPEPLTPQMAGGRRRRPGHAARSGLLAYRRTPLITSAMVSRERRAALSLPPRQPFSVSPQAVRAISSNYRRLSPRFVVEKRFSPS